MDHHCHRYRHHHHHHHGHPSSIWSVTMHATPTKPYVAPCTSKDNYPSAPIIVRLYFRHWRELHRPNCHHVDDSPYFLDNDHNTLLLKDLVDPGFGVILVFPLEPETLGFHVATAEICEEGGLPDFLTVGALNYVKEKVLGYLLQHVDFDDVQGLGFRMVAAVDISTVNVLDDHRDLDRDDDHDEDEDAAAVDISTVVVLGDDDHDEDEDAAAVDISTVDVLGDDHHDLDHDDDDDHDEDEDDVKIRLEKLVERILADFN